MNYYKDVAKMFGLELEEEFKINPITNNLFMFTKGGLMFRNIHDVDWNNGFSAVLTGLLRGNYTVEKLPFKPRRGDEYYYYSIVTKEPLRKIWANSTTDFLFWKTGNCFRTRIEAGEKGKAIMKDIVKEFINSVGTTYDINSFYPSNPEVVYEKNK